MGLLIKIFKIFILPLLFAGFIRSLLQDVMRQTQRGGPRRNWQRGPWESGQRGPGDGYGAGAFGGASRSAYEVFGLPRNATDDQVRARYRELISKYHPDKFAGMNDPEFSRLAAEKFQQVQGAYEEIKRQRGI